MTERENRREAEMQRVICVFRQRRIHLWWKGRFTNRPKRSNHEDTKKRTKTKNTLSLCALVVKIIDKKSLPRHSCATT